MDQGSLVRLAVLLLVAAIAAPLAKRLKVSSILGYIAAGVVIGPFGLRLFTEVENILHIAEFGVVLLLFLIGLELRPQRLVTMRGAVFGLGGAQVALTAGAIAGALIAYGMEWRQAAFFGLALSLSSTAFVLQMLKERRELELRHGRLSFAVLLFQDLAAIPMIAFLGLLATEASAEGGMTWLGAAEGVGAIALLVLAGRYGLNPLYRLIAMTGLKEAMTASALLTVVVAVLLMESVGLSPALGAFIAGVLLADSEYRHEIEANIQPFEGLLLGLFFLSVGMGLNLKLLLSDPLAIVLVVLLLVAAKTVILFAAARRYGVNARSSRRLALALSQGGEFAYVLGSAAVTRGVIGQEASDFLAIAVTLSMISTPLLLLLDDLVAARKKVEPAYDPLPEAEAHVIIAGFGRFGQIVGRILAAKHIPFTALDNSPEQIDFVRRFGARIYYGDASRLDILEAAQADKARAFVLAIDDMEASLRTAEIVKRHYPLLPIFARARNRQHFHRLMDLGVASIERETFPASLEMARQVLRGLGLTEAEAKRTVSVFAASDVRRLIEDYAHFTDLEMMRSNAKRHAAELEQLFAADEEERKKGAA